MHEFTLDLQLFGGGKGTTVQQMPAQVQAPTQTQLDLEKENLNYIRSLQPSLQGLVQLANNSLGIQPTQQPVQQSSQNTVPSAGGLKGGGLHPMAEIAKRIAEKNGQPTTQTSSSTPAYTLSGGNQVMPDYRGMYAQGLGQVYAANQTINDLNQGRLNPAYAASQQEYVKSSMKPWADAMQSLASSGLVGRNSAVGDMTNQFESNLQSNALQGFRQDLSTASQLANQQQSSALAPINFGAAAQQAATYLPSTYYSMAMGNYQPQQNMYGQLLNQQTALSSPAQTVVSQGNGGFFGDLLQGAGAYYGAACFVAGTKIATPTGDKNIEDVLVGDQVYSLDANNQRCVETVTWIQEPTMSPDRYVKIKAGVSEVITTHTQPFITPEGDVFPDNLKDKVVKSVTGDHLYVTAVVPAEKELVYDLSTTGQNIYFANSIAARGRV